MNVTIHDVAEAAGVSVATASRALSGRRRVSPESERLVREASHRLGYRTNTVARSLRMQSTATVGMVVPRISNPYFPRLVEAVERELSTRGLELLLCDSQSSPAVEASRVDALLDRRVDGLLFVSCDSTQSAPTLVRARSRTPVVQMDRYIPGADIDFVGSDNEAGIRLVIDHLRQSGRSSFAFVSATTTDSTAYLRLASYRAEVGRIDAASADRVLLGEYSVEWGRAAVGLLLESGPLPDAIVCGADVVALGVNAALAELRVDVPGEVAVTGFDDISFASLSSPTLTTLRQPAEEIGAEAVRLLGDQIGHVSGDATTILLSPSLVVRGSTV